MATTGKKGLQDLINKKKDQGYYFSNLGPFLCYTNSTGMYKEDYNNGKKRSADRFMGSISIRRM